jgi:hypothetical protein
MAILHSRTSRWALPPTKLDLPPMLERRLNRYPSKHLTIVCREVPLALRYWALTLISGYGEIRQTKSRDRSGPVRAASLNAAAVSLPRTAMR